MHVIYYAFTFKSFSTEWRFHVQVQVPVFVECRSQHEVNFIKMDNFASGQKCPSRPKRPVDVKRRASEYIDGP